MSSILLIYYIFPNLSNFVFRTETAHGLAPSGAMIFGAIAYSIVYIAILLIITAAIFSRRNFK